MNRHPLPYRRARNALFASIAALLLPASAGAVSFPQYPLQTASPIPPNILFILDDSGSMSFLTMPVDSAGELADSLSTKASVNNTVYYNPTVTYRPWMQASGSRMTGGTSFRSAFADYDQASGDVIDLADAASCANEVQNGATLAVCGGPTQATYYVLKTGQTASTTDRTRYYRYQIRLIGGAVRVVRSEWLTSGSTDATMGCPDPGNRVAGWRACTYATPTGRSEADEATNFATWFSYHRSRMKMAKAGASEAFSSLGNTVRVGFRTIWNRNTFNIPVQDGNSGLFENATGAVTTTSRTTWFQRLQTADSGGSTPLRGALQNAGEYFKQTAATGPYGPQTGTAQYQCRQNFSILTTDGYWNNDANFVAADIGEQDNANGVAILNPVDNTNIVRYTAALPYSGATTNTLGDIAMKYWKTDLRTDMSNIVPTSTTNPAFWQHMVTFGISIGQKGSIDQTSVAALVRDGSPRINGVNVAWPAPGNNKTAENIDDLLHASLNGHGEFIAAANATDFATAMNAVLGKIQARLASGSNIATNSTSFQSDTRMYQASYMSSQWTGDVVAYAVTSSGGISTNEAWRVSSRVAASMTDANNRNDFNQRTVLTWDTSRNRSASFPTSDQETALGRTMGTYTLTGADNAAYIKGTQTNEVANGGRLRNRSGLIGDIVNSSPYYVKDTETLYVGANDGMMHAINTLTGDVVFSYVPAGIDFARLATISDPAYDHSFFVDGPVVVSDRASVGSNYLVGALGRGGKGVFALNVTTPTNPSVMWDKTATTDADMGYVLSTPLVVQSNTGNPIVVVANGIDSTNGSAALYIYDAASGSQLRKLVVDAGPNNGLFAVRGADVDNDRKVDYIYAGDLKGHIWKFDLTNNSSSAWNVALSGQPLFTAASGQPITGGIAIAKEPGTYRTWITFGTGRLISSSDVSSTTQQALYGIIDTNTPATVSDLTQRTIAATGTVDSRNVRSFERYQVLPGGSRGWYINLGTPTPGERMVSGPRVKGRAAFYSTVIPSANASGCDVSGTGYLNALDLFTGTSPFGDGGSSSFFDLNNDGSGSNDTLGTGDSALPIGSVDLGVGMPTESAQIDNFVLLGGSTGGRAGTHVAGTSGASKRVGWREIFTRN